MSCTSLFLMSSNSQLYWRTASAVPWNHSLPPRPGVRVAASTSTKPLPPYMMPLPKLYVRARWRLSDTELNCVWMYIRRCPS